MGLIMLFANMGRLLGPLWAGFAYPSDYNNSGPGNFGSEKVYLVCGGFIVVASLAFLVGYMKFQKKRYNTPVALCI